MIVLGPTDRLSDQKVVGIFIYPSYELLKPELGVLIRIGLF